MRKVLLLVALMGFVLPATADARRRRRKPRLTKKDRLAKEHFAQGETFYQQGEFGKALENYKKALSYRQHPSMIFNIAQCHWQLKRYEKAKFFYKLYLDEAKNPGNKAAVDKRIKECDDAIAAAERKRNMKGTVQLATHPPGAQIRVDAATGPVALTTPGSLALAPGVHTLYIHLDSHRPVVRSVKVEPGKTIVLDVTLVSTKPIPIPKPKPAPLAKPLHKRGWFWTGVVATAVLTVSAVLTGSLALARNSTWEETRLESDRKAVRALAITTDAMIALAAAAAVSTAVGIILHYRSRKKERPTAVVAPSCGPSGCGLWVTGRF